MPQLPPSRGALEPRSQVATAPDRRPSASAFSPEPPKRGPRSLPERCFLAAALLGAGGAAGLAFAGHHRFLTQDGVGLLTLLCSPFETRRHWHHPLHLEWARALQGCVETPFEALALTSALAFGLGLALLASILSRIPGTGPGRAGLALGGWLCVLASPAAWFHGRLIEVHTAQFLGATVVLALAQGMGSAPPWKRFLATALGLLLAGLLHRANLLLAAPLGLAAWITAPGWPGRRSWRDRGLLAVGLGIAAALPGLLYGWSFSDAGSDAAGYSLWLLVTFWRGISLEYLRDDLFFALPLLPLVLLSGVRGLRRSADQFGFVETYAWLSLLILTAFFVAFGESTRGGYLLSAAPALAFVWARSGGPIRPAGSPPSAPARVAARPAWLQLAAPLAAGGLALLWCRPTDEPTLRAHLEDKLAAVSELHARVQQDLVLYSIDPTGQVVNGQDPAVFEVHLADQIAEAVLLGAEPKGLADRVVPAMLAQARARGLPVLMRPGGWRPEALGSAEAALVEALLENWSELVPEARWQRIGEFDFLF